jgi:hypothetical protein
MKLKTNWEYKHVKHPVEMMWLSGVSVRDVEGAVLTGEGAAKSERVSGGILQTVLGCVS